MSILKSNLLEDESVEEIHDRYHAESIRLGQISRLEQDIKLAEMRLERESAYLRLEGNKDWKEIVEEGFFKDLANGAIRSLGKGTQGNVPKEEWVEILSSIGHLQTYLEGVIQFGSKAKVELPQMKDELARLKSISAVIN